ncbi:hypothetical protein AV530_016914 [Patagioenas fasciata monilis]|uniref:Uncharacterized protein n=1 Tax=Patagioenas fasciata monilis TaxID=372326 RepID=A0A1V4J4I9_PATFA|nr:hypothetical protein AV530_016914 [Patagioenas fasciata monilis]
MLTLIIPCLYSSPLHLVSPLLEASAFTSGPYFFISQVLCKDEESHNGLLILGKKAKMCSTNHSFWLSPVCLYEWEYSSFGVSGHL